MMMSNIKKSILQVEKILFAISKNTMWDLLKHKMLMLSLANSRDCMRENLLSYRRMGNIVFSLVFYSNVSQQQHNMMMIEKTSK